MKKFQTLEEATKDMKSIYWRSVEDGFEAVEQSEVIAKGDLEGNITTLRKNDLSFLQKSLNLILESLKQQE